MRIPAKPPSWQKTVEQSQPDLAVLAQAESTEQLELFEKYYHWDKLRYLKAPERLTPEQWWAINKIWRLGQYRTIPLHDCQGIAFRYALTDRLQSVIHRIDSLINQSARSSDSIANSYYQQEYIQTSLLDEAITSSQLEGAATTREDARAMIRNGKAPSNTSERMILNNYQTIQHIKELQDQELTPDIVLAIHREITENTLDKPDAAGRFRYASEQIDVADHENNILHTPPDASRLPDRVAVMCDFANGKTPDRYISPVIRAMILHFWLAYEHPFVDGNGRTARALFYWCMLRNGYRIAEFLSISEIILRGPSRYGRAFLHTETDDNDLTYFLLYHADVLLKAVDQLESYVARKGEALRTLENQLEGMRGLNPRQQAILSHALKHPDTQFTIERHKFDHNVTYQTARTDLLNLEERGFMQKYKKGRKWMFLAVPELQSRLGKAE